MRLLVLVTATGLLVGGCHTPPASPAGSASKAGVSAEPPLAVAPQPWGLKRCDAEPLDYPDATDLPRPAHVSFASLPPDPVFVAMGVPLVTFRSSELVFHVSPDLSQALVDCTVAAADDGVAFVTSALALPRVFEGGPTRDVFVLRPDAANDVLERLDPGYGFGRDATDGQAFVAHPRGRKDVHAIFAWKKMRLSYLDLGLVYAHEWLHMIQDHVRGARPTEIDTVVEGEANLLGVLFQDAVLPGSATLFWDSDVQNLARAHAGHPELTPYELLTQPPHQYHQEVTLFAYLSRSVPPPTLARVRLLARAERLDYETAWQRVVGRNLLDPGLEGIVKDPKLAPRPPVAVSAPTLTIVRSEDRLWFVAPGFRAGERASRSVRRPDGRVDKDEVQADTRGVVAWAWKLRTGSQYVAKDVEVRGESGVCAGRYYDRVP